jgi:hypothetical protein
MGISQQHCHPAALRVLLFHSGLILLQKVTPRNFRWTQISVSFGVGPGLMAEVVDLNIVVVVAIDVDKPDNNDK